MKTLLLLIILSQGTDVSTSLVAFHRGATELNPLVLSTKPAPFIAEGVLFTGAEMYLLKKLSKHHPKLAKTLGYVQVGGSFGATANNINVIRKLQ
jgi:hypothetical protein